MSVMAPNNCVLVVFQESMRKLDLIPSTKQDLIISLPLFSLLASYSLLLYIFEWDIHTFILVSIPCIISTKVLSDYLIYLWNLHYRNHKLR